MKKLLIALLAVSYQSTSLGAEDQVSVSLVRYQLTSTGKKSSKDSRVRVELRLPDGTTSHFPEQGKEWVMKSGQSEAILKTFAIPKKSVQNDRFEFEVQIHRDGKDIQPCHIVVENLSQFQRSYLCRSDFAAQQKMGRSADQMTDESIEVRVSKEPLQVTHSKLMAQKSRK